MRDAAIILAVLLYCAMYVVLGLAAALLFGVAVIIVLLWTGRS